MGQSVKMQRVHTGLGLGSGTLFSLQDKWLLRKVGGDGLACEEHRCYPF